MLPTLLEWLVRHHPTTWSRWQVVGLATRWEADGEKLVSLSSHHFVLRLECAVRAWTRRFCASSCGWFVVLGVARPDHWPWGCRGWFLGVWWHLAVCGLICHQQGAALLSTFHWLFSDRRRTVDIDKRNRRNPSVYIIIIISCSYSYQFKLDNFVYINRLIFETILNNIHTMK